MWIIGCDYHPSFQQIAFVNLATGEHGNLRLDHKSGEAEKFYRAFHRRAGAGGSGGGTRHPALVRTFAGGTEDGDMGRRSGKSTRRQPPGKPKPINRMRSCCCVCCWRIGFRGSGYLLRNSVMPGNWCYIGIGWCRPGPVPRTGCSAIAANEGLHPKRRVWSKAGQAELMALELPPWTRVQRQAGKNCWASSTSGTSLWMLLCSSKRNSDQRCNC